MRGGGEAFVCQLEKAKRECVRAAKTGLSRSSHVVCSHSSLEKKSFSLPHDARRPPRPPRPRAARRIRRRARPGADAAQGAGFGGEWARSFFFLFVRQRWAGPAPPPAPRSPPLAVRFVQHVSSCACTHRRRLRNAPAPAFPTHKSTVADALPSLPPTHPQQQGVTQPPVVPKFATAKFGFVDNAELLNSRAAMLGFFGILAVEAIAGKGIFEMAGFSIGNGLPFEF